MLTAWLTMKRVRTFDCGDIFCPFTNSGNDSEVHMYAYAHIDRVRKNDRGHISLLLSAYTHSYTPACMHTCTRTHIKYLLFHKAQNFACRDKS